MEIKKCIKKLVTSEGAFKIMQTDNGLELKNYIVDEFCHNYLIQRIYGRPRHPQSQGIVERFNQTVTRYLQKHLFAKYDNDKKASKRLIDILDLTVYNYNISAHESTKKSPFVLFRNRDGFNACLSPCFEIENNDLSKDYREARINQMKYFETRFVDKQKTNVKSFKIGDKILVQKDFDNNTKTKKKKLESFYEGPFEIKEVLKNDTLVIVSEEKIVRVKTSRCKLL